MPPFRISGDGYGVVCWRMTIEEAKELAEYLESVDVNRDRFKRAQEMAFDLRQGVQKAIANPLAPTR